MSSETNKLIRNSTAEFLMFTAQSGEQSIEARYEDETVWLSQKLMAELSEVGVNTINYHLKEIFKNNEVDNNSVIRKFRTTAGDGKSYNTNFYNFDAIISVGYRVNPLRATQFRQWATKVLGEFAIKGFILDKKQLENGSYLNENYFEELLAEIREIRLSERKFYQKITDVSIAKNYLNKEELESLGRIVNAFLDGPPNKISTHSHIVSKRAYGDRSSDYLKNCKKVLIGPSIPSIRKISDSNQKKLRNYKTRSGSSPVNNHIKEYRGRND